MKHIAERSDVDSRHLPDDVLHSEVPVVLRGLVNNWPAAQAAQRGSAEIAHYLCAHWQGATVGMLIGPPEIEGRFFYNETIDGFNFQREKANLAEVIDTLIKLAPLEVAPALYVGSTTVDTALPGFRAANDINLGARGALMSLWLGNKSRIAAHFDLPDNIACVVAGHRRFTLFPPEQLSNLYIGPIDFTPAGQAVSMVDFHKPDFERYPRFAQALESAQVAELGPGDALFIPSMWWHHIEALDSFNLLVNYWWRDTPEYMDSPMTTLMLALLTLRELPPAQRKAWSGMFQHYIFDGAEVNFDHLPASARYALAPLDAAGARELRNQLLNRLKR